MKCIHNRDYRCYLCGECYPCAHKQIYKHELWWWICPEGIHRVGSNGKVFFLEDKPEEEGRDE